MANTASPRGLFHWGNTEGSSPTFGQDTSRLIAAADTTAIGFGDPVKLLSTGYIARWTAGTAVSQLAGFLVGCQYQSNSGQGLIRSRWWPGSGNTGDVTAIIVPLNLASSVGKFLIQSVGATGILFADIGANVDFSMGTVDTVTGQSGAGADQSTLAATATLPLRVIGMGPANGPSGLGNDNTLANNWIIVAANVAGAGSTGI
jgi:hypothetical protein